MREIGIAAALGSAASWAVGSILFKQLGERISPLALTLSKGVVSVGLLGVATLLVGYEEIGQQPLLLLIVSGVLGIALGDTFFFEALQNLSPHVLVVLLMLGQVVTVILAVLFLQEMPAPIVWFGIVLVVFGISIVLFSKLTEESSKSNLRGVVFGLLSVLCMSISIIIAKKALDSVSTIQATFIRMLAGTLGMFLFGLSTRRLARWIVPFKDTKLIGFFLFSVCVVTFGGFWLSLVGVKYVDVAVANTLNSTEPLFVIPLAAIFLKEPISLKEIVGTIIATAGIMLICLN